MRDRKGTEDDYVPGNVLKLLVDDGPRLMMPLINDMYDIEEWSGDFFEGTMIALKNQKLQNAVTIAVSLMTYIAKAARILRRRIERKMEDVLGED